MMQQQPDKNTMQEALRLANSPAGQKLFALLKQAGGDAVNKAGQQAAKGDFSQAKNTLSQLLQSEEIQKLLKEMGQKNE